MFNLDDLEKRVLNDYYRVNLEYPKKPEGYRKEGYVYDENQTVKWNKEHRLELEAEYQKQLSEFHNMSRNKSVEFELDLKKALSEEFNLSANQVKNIASRAYDEGHSDGLQSIIYNARELAEFAIEIINDIEE